MERKIAASPRLRLHEVDLIQNLSFFADDNRDMTEPCRAPILFIPNNKYYFVQHNYNV